MVFKYGAWPNEGTENAKVLANTNNRFTLSERKFAESVLRCCPCVFRCRRAIGIEDDQTTAITTTNNQPENITPVISLTINRSPETIEKLITNENERNNKNIENITESIIIQVQNTNNQLYQNQFPGQENHAGNNVPNGVINRNNQEEHDRTSERNTKSGVSVLERSPSSIRSYHSDRFSVNTPTHSIHPTSESVEIQTSSDEKLPMIKNRAKIFNQSFGQRNSLKSDKLPSDELISVHSRLSKSANATSSKYKTKKLNKKSFNKSLPSISRPKVPLHLHPDSFKRSDSIESLTDESFVEKGSSSATEQNGNVDNDLPDPMAKTLDTEANNERLGSSSSQSTVKSAISTQLSNDQKPASRINSSVPKSGQSLRSNRAISSQSNNRQTKSGKSEKSLDQEIVTETASQASETSAAENENKTEVSTENQTTVKNTDEIDTSAKNREEVPNETTVEQEDVKYVGPEEVFGNQLNLSAETDLYEESNEKNNIGTEDDNHVTSKDLSGETDDQRNNNCVLLKNGEIKTENGETEHSTENNNEAEVQIVQCEENAETKTGECKEEQKPIDTLPKKVPKKNPIKQNIAKKQISTKSKIHLQQCFSQLESKDWEEIIKGLNNLSQIARQEPEILDTCPSGIISRLLGRHIKSLRSQVSRTACSVVGDIYNCSIRVTDQDLDDIIKPLLHRTADTNKFLRADSNIALDRIVENFPPHRTISIIVLRGAIHQNAIVRATTGRLLNSILNSIGPMNLMLLQRDIRNKYLNTSAKLLTDGNLNARNHAKDIFRQIVHCDGFRRALSESVSESTIRHIDKTLRSL